MPASSSQPALSSSRRERRPTDKIIQKKAEDAANAERVRIKKERCARKAHARRHQRVDDDDEDDENETQDEIGFVDSTFTNRVVASKTQAIKEKALTLRSTRVPFSEVRNDPRSCNNENQLERGRSIQRFNDQNPSYDRSPTHSLSPSHSKSQSCSPVPTTGQKRRSSSSDSSSDTQMARYSKSSRPKAGDYDDIIQAILSHAIKEYRCKVSTTYAYPNMTQVITFSTESWDAACQHLSIHEQLTPRIARIIMKGGSQLRGELKTKAQPLVETYFGFDSANNRKAIKKNRQMAEFLKEEHSFIFKELDFTTDPPTKGGIYQSKLIQNIVNRVWFVGPKDEGIIYDNYFNPFTKQCLALVLTAIEACIDEWTTGVRIAQNFKGADYEDIYNGHIKELDRFEKHTIKYELLDRILLRLYNCGRFHAGAQPLSMVGFPIIPDKAFDDAIKEYEEGSATDTDGESGNRD